MPLLKVSVKPDHFEKYIFGEISEKVFSKLIEVKTTAKRPGSHSENWEQIKDKTKLYYTLGIKPSFETWLNDPSGFFKYRLGIKPFAITHLWKGAYGYARYTIPFYSNIWSSNIPPPETIRGDTFKYLRKRYTLGT